MANEEVPLDLTGVADQSLVTGWELRRIDAYRELNQDEMRYDDLVNSTTTWQDAIAAIKAKYPKPEE
jgi:hypothetical protein